MSSSQGDFLFAPKTAVSSPVEAYFVASDNDACGNIPAIWNDFVGLLVLLVLRPCAPGRLRGVFASRALSTRRIGDTDVIVEKTEEIGGVLEVVFMYSEKELWRIR